MSSVEVWAGIKAVKAVVDAWAWLRWQWWRGCVHWHGARYVRVAGWNEESRQYVCARDNARTAFENGTTAWDYFVEGFHE